LPKQQAVLDSETILRKEAFDLPTQNSRMKGHESNSIARRESRKESRYNLEVYNIHRRKSGH